MDRSLDEAIAERQRSNHRDHRPPPRRQNYPRDGVRKSIRDDRTNLENDWVHDRYDDDDRSAKFDPSRTRARPRNSSWRDGFDGRRNPDPDDIPLGAKLRVENLHYDITEDELYDLFKRIAPVESVTLMYDRAGRSHGTAFVVYPQVADARSAIKEFDGANAKGQPVRLNLLPPSAPVGGRNETRTRQEDNLFDRIENPRSLFDRVEAPRSKGRTARSASPGERVARGGRGRASTLGNRRSDVSRPAPDGIDRYVPGQDRVGGGSSTNRRGPDRRDGGRRPGERKGPIGGGRDGIDPDRHRLVNGRPRMTQEELDAEMEDYWGRAAGPAEPGMWTNGVAETTTANTTATTAAAPVPADANGEDDIDMIE